MSKNKLFKKEQPLCEKIYKQNFSDYFDSLPKHEQAFNPEDRSIRCIDEGTPQGIHIAGSGILLSLEEVGRIISDIDEVDGIYSHENCDIAALEVERKSIDKDPNKLAQRAAKEIAAEVNLPYLGHISSENMKRPADTRTARVVYYDGTGSFDWSQVDGLPTGVTISREYLYSDYAKDELEISLDIAFGNSGFGNLFTSDNPLLIIILAETGEMKDRLQQEVKSVLSNYNSDRIQVETYIKD